MKLYHGSTVDVEKPDLQKCRLATDFGLGFYTTTSFEQLSFHSERALGNLKFNGIKLLG
jgi:hypothetical protein